MACAEPVAEAVGELWAVGFDEVVLDLYEVDFLDASGLTMLLALRDDAERDGRGLVLVAPRPQAGGIFDITRTRGLFDWRERLAPTRVAFDLEHRVAA